MSALRDAKAHLTKAEEFYEAASLSMDLDLFNAATSNAVTSGINSKDAICLKLTGTTGKSDNHAAAVGELRKAGKAGAEVAADLQRLLGAKTKSQYRAVGVAKKDAENAIRWARNLLDTAQRVVRS